jgi:hypothetical protein
MRVRAYVEDARWGFAVSLTPNRSPSQIVQAGLVRLVENHHSGGTTNPAGGVLAARRRLGLLAQQVYASGYQAGLLLCDSLDWAELDSLAGDSWPQAALDSISATVQADSAGENPNASTNLYRTGLCDALLNVWCGVRAGDCPPLGGGVPAKPGWG